MIEIVGFYRGIFTQGQYLVVDGDDRAMLGVLMQDFVGAVYPKFKVITGGANEK